MKLIECFTPRPDNSAVTGLLLLSAQLNGGIAGFSLSPDGSIQRIQNNTVFGNIGIDEEFDLDCMTLHDAIGKNSPTVMVCLARHVWAFPSYLSDEEIEFWDKPVERHPESFQVFEMVTATRNEKKQWMVEYRTEGPSLIKLTNIYEIGQVAMPDPRISSADDLPDQVKQDMGLTEEESDPKPIKSVIQLDKKRS